MYFSQGDGKVNTPNNRKGNEHLPREQIAQEGLANSPTGEPICGDATTEPAEADIEQLCKVWAEVGRAILIRRKQAHEEESLS
ncbi:MAG: hypothetical protein O3A33_03185 [Chloroflexi bacterium]|nr:hypothetical protein [Chloroflexota bacterium]